MWILHRPRLRLLSNIMSITHLFYCISMCSEYYLLNQFRREKSVCIIDDIVVIQPKIFLKNLRNCMASF